MWHLDSSPDLPDNQRDMEKNHLEVLLEDMHSKFDAVTELVSGMAEDVTTLKEDVGALSVNVATLKDDVHVIKAVVTEQSGELKETKERLTALEARSRL